MEFEKSLKYLLKAVCIFIGFMFFFGCGTVKNSVEKPVEKPHTDYPKIDSIKTSSIESDFMAPPPFSIRDVPETPREFRGAWVATVANIDWPSQPGLPVAQQKAEIKAIMDRAALLNLNAIILQVRPSADALYDSPYEPWSEFLTGKQGKAPEPYYDPLKFAIQQAHQRGVELHAWFNPFRAYHPAGKNDFASNHIMNIHPEWVVKYGDYYWLDPGQKEVRQYSLRVIMDVVRRYDIDGVHLDDYFYPYPQFNSNRKAIPFPDEETYTDYVQIYGPIKRGDWRRQNVNKFVKHLGRAIQKVDSALFFGISPFGIWRPGYPPQIRGLDAYARIFADARKWLRKGWVDYLAPQLYWSIADEAQSFPVLLQWWNQQNYQNRYVWPGLFTSGLGNYPESGWPSSEILNQIRLIRQRPETAGHIHFSISSLMQNYGNITNELLAGLYREQALVPAATRLAVNSPPKPKAKLKTYEHKFVISLNSKNSSDPWLWVIKTRYGQNWEIDIYPGWKDTVSIARQTKNGTFSGAAVAAINEQRNESRSKLLFPYSAIYKKLSN